MVKILHFADAHIDMANYGRHDPQTGLPLRVIDFLKSLDQIVNTAIEEQVDLVLFAGDAYKDRTPAPTFQREWGRRIMQLSKANIPTVLLVGNHDLSPAIGRANALENFDTLEVPNVKVISHPCLLQPQDLAGVPLQLLALPWISRSGMMAAQGLQTVDTSLVYEQMVNRLTELVSDWLSQVEGSLLPVVLTAHGTVQGAKLGGERSVMLGHDLVLPGALVKDRRLNYVALGHIHKAQDLNQGSQPPVVYPGSIERVDFGEAADEKYFVIAYLQPGADTTVEWRKLVGIRKFIDRSVHLTDEDGVTDRLRNALPPRSELRGAIVRLVVEYPRDRDALIDEAALREYTSECFEFHLIRRPHSEARIRLADHAFVGSLSPLELVDQYWLVNKPNDKDLEALRKLASQVVADVHHDGLPLD